MRKPKILLGLTGSVATVLAPKIVKALQEIGEVSVVVTEKAEHFIDGDSWASLFAALPNSPERFPHIFTEANEWNFSAVGRQIWAKNDPVLHIDLREWADVLVVAPLTANTLAKFANGICDTLLTSTFRAWDKKKPIVLAPAMNTEMYVHPLTIKHLSEIRRWYSAGICDNSKVVYPVSKKLACGTEGLGALAPIEDIVKATKEALKWSFPLGLCPGVPVTPHPGAFGYRRRNSFHTGVDLYTRPWQNVYTVEPGIVVGIEPFTGPWDNSPHYNNTSCVLVEGRTGVVCYGEIKPDSDMVVGRKVARGVLVGRVEQVLPDGRERPDIPGHSKSMLHLELYTYGRTKASTSWKHDAPQHDYLLDPTPFLLDAVSAPETHLTWTPAEEKQ
jgi:phosphopantothenoylcysteine decarboxylase